MMFTGAGSLPRHIYCYADSTFVRKDGQGYEPVVWFGLTSMPGRVWGCHVMLECGAVYRSLPPHAIAFSPEPAGSWPVDHAQYWDCYGWNFSTIEYPFLAGLRLTASIKGEEWPGDYLFTAIPLLDGFSVEPEQNKEFMFCKLDNGRLSVQPTNRVLFKDKSFTVNEEWPKNIKLQTEQWSCEG